MGNLLIIYIVISCVFWIVSAFAWVHSDKPKEIENVFDWFWYGMLWCLVLIKHLFIFLHKFFKL